MNKTFFTEDEDFQLIIKNIFDNIIEIKKITTGWTNIVFTVKTNNNKEYIAKFPRDGFWAMQIEKDAKIANFISNNVFKNTNFIAPKPKIYNNNNRKFIIYEKIYGYSLTEKFNLLSNEKLNNITKQLAKIFTLFHNFNLKKISKEIKNDYFKFILSMVSYRERNDNSIYDMNFFKDMLLDINLEKQVLSHNDLNIGNVILDKNDNVKAIIDYSFCGLSDIYTDLAVISCRTNDYFFSNIIKEYELLNNIKLNKDKLENRKKLRKHIEDVYINYMRTKCPSIKV